MIDTQKDWLLDKLKNNQSLERLKESLLMFRKCESEILPLYDSTQLSQSSDNYKFSRQQLYKKKDELLQRFSQDFLSRHKHNAILCTMIESMIRGQNEYVVIEQLINIIQSMQESMIDHQLYCKGTYVR